MYDVVSGGLPNNAMAGLGGVDVEEGIINLEYATESEKRDKDIVMVAVGRNGHDLKYAHQSLKRDREVVTKAVTQNGHALRHASVKLRGDKQIVKTAMDNNPWALLHATEDVKLSFLN